jgi:hypothetical protein
VIVFAAGRAARERFVAARIGLAVVADDRDACACFAARGVAAASVSVAVVHCTGSTRASVAGRARVGRVRCGLAWWAVGAAASCGTARATVAARIRTALARADGRAHATGAGLGTARAGDARGATQRRALGRAAQAEVAALERALGLRLTAAVAARVRRRAVFAHAQLTDKARAATARRRDPRAQEQGADDRAA